MSMNYAAGLSHYPDKGKCGLPERIDSLEDRETKSLELAELLRLSRHCVVLTGAGVSTSVGIPDFRGPSGVWTLEERGEDLPASSVTFDNAKPSVTHLCLNALESAGYIKFLITQNVDGLHLRSGFPRNKMAILHGDMFIEECSQCKTQYIRKTAVQTMGRKFTGNLCIRNKQKGGCRGKLIDTILDWEDNLPDIDLDLAQQNSKEADMIICLGTSLQIEPCGSLPIINLKKSRKRVKVQNTSIEHPKTQLVIVNLQATKQDKYATLRIYSKVDEIMSLVCAHLGVMVPEHVSIPLLVLKSQFTPSRERLPWRIIVDENKEDLKRKLEVI